MERTFFGRTKEARATHTDDETLCRSFFNETWVEGKTGRLGDYLAKDFTTNPPPGYQADVKGYRKQVDDFHAGFKDVEGHLEEVVANNGRVAAHWVIEGTHSGEWMNIPPTGKRVRMEGIALETVRDGRIVHEHVAAELVPLFLELGATDLTKMVG